MLADAGPAAEPLRDQSHLPLLLAAATVLLMAPWLNPFAPGPSPSLMPWLVTLFCGAVLLLLAPWVTARVVANAWLAAALVSACIGLLQYTGLVHVFYPWFNQSAVGEAFGNLRQRNQFASLMNMGLAVLIWRGAGTQDSAGHAGGAARHLRPWLAPAGATLLAAATAASASRTGMLQLLLLAALGILWGTTALPGVRRLVITAALAYFLAAGLLPLAIGHDLFYQTVFVRLADESAPCSSRLVLWSNVLHLIGLRPWTGWGWGELDYAHFATLYPGDRFCDILDNAHDLPLHLAVELGIPVALLACGALAWFTLRARPWRETNPVRQLAWAVLVVIGVHSLLEYPLWYGPFLTAAVLCVAMLWIHPAGDAPAVRRRLPLAAAARIGLAVLVLASLCYAAWDYHRISQIYTAPEARDRAYRDNTLAKVKESWLFADQVRFAELTMSPVSQANAAAMHALASASIHYSPEPAVIERLIESAVILNLDDEAIQDLARYKAAFPKEHAAWNQANAKFARQAP